MTLLVFSLAGKEYAIEIKNVSQVIRMKEIIPVPQAPVFVEGVISWHQKVTPLINLRTKLSLSPSDKQQLTRIILCKINQDAIGMIVDEVTDVLKADAAAIEPPDQILQEVPYLSGVAKLGKRIILIMDVEKLFSQEDKSGLQGINARVELKTKG